MKKFAVCIIIAKVNGDSAKVEDIFSQLYVVDSPSKEEAKDFILHHRDIEEAKRQGFTNINTNICECL